MVDPHQPKLANFEYAVEKKAKMQKKSKVVENIYTNCAYNWLAPEVLAGDYNTEASDMYGLCSVIWELFNSKFIWSFIIINLRILVLTIAKLLRENSMVRYAMELN